jgi:hypothetical protein
MLPTTSTNSFVSEASDDMITNEPWSIETYAEGLMDDLFTDIDTILEGRNKRNYNKNKYIRTESSEYVSGETVTLTLSDVIPSTVNLPQDSVTPITHKQSSALVVNARPLTAITTTKQQSHSLTKLILIASTLIIASLGFIWLKESGSFNNEYSETPNIETPDDPLLTLVNYMQEALTVIDQKENINAQTNLKSNFPPINTNQSTALATENNQPTTTLPLSVTANSLPAVPNRNTTQNVIERIYIPMSQPSSPKYQVPTIPTVPTVPKTATPVEIWKDPINTKNNIKTATKPTDTKTITTNTKIPALNTKPLPVNSQPLKVAPPKLPTTIPPLPTNTQVQEPVKVPQQTYLPTYTAQLDGLLELGNKSVALFKIDGVSRRISIGESIGTTGWTLVEVSNGEVVIRRNGEVRSIYTGQKL